MSAVPAPVFILAAPFSGASYLAGQLAAHPQLYAVPELCLFMADNVGELLDIFSLSQGPHGDGLLRAVAQLEFGAQTDAEIGAARDWLAQRRALGVGELLGQLAARAAPRRLVVPDTETPLRPIDLRRLLRQVPDARAIHLVRHPWTQGCRMSAWARERLFVPPDFKDHGWSPAVVDPQIPWLRANRNIETAFAARDLLRLRDEALRLGPGMLVYRDAIDGLCRALALEHSAVTWRVMQAAAPWVYAGLGPRAAPYGLEAEVLETLAANDEALAEQCSLDAALPWRPGAEGFDAAVGMLAREYGYR